MTAASCQASVRDRCRCSLPPGHRSAHQCGHNPTPPPEPEPDTRYGPDGTTTPTGTLPTDCRRCGDYGTHKHLCPSRAK